MIPNLECWVAANTTLPVTAPHMDSSINEGLRLNGPLGNSTLPSSATMCVGQQTIWPCDEILMPEPSVLPRLLKRWGWVSSQEAVPKRSRWLISAAGLNRDHSDLLSRVGYSGSGLRRPAAPLSRGSRPTWTG
jgi:hypothetical protein